MFYYLPQGWPLYQKIDTLFRRITWQRHAVHCQLQGPVTDLGLTMHKHALLYKWLARRRQEGVVPEQAVSQRRGLLSPRLPPIS